MSITELNEHAEAGRYRPDGEPGEYRSIWKYLYKTPHALGYIDAAGLGTRYLTAGSPDAPPLLLLHGTAGSIENFSANIAAYAEHFRVYVLDMLGCGWTDKPDYPYTPRRYAEHVVAFMDAVGLDRADVVGVSLGSFVAARIAQDYPGRVGKIVSVAPAGIITDPVAYQKNAQELIDRRSKASADPTWDSIRFVFENLVLDKGVLIDDLIGIRLDIYRNPALQEAMPHLLTPKGVDALTWEEWAELPNEILVVASVDKPTMFLDNAYKIAELNPHVTLWELAGVDHWAQFEVPEEFNFRTISWLKGDGLQLDKTV
ncbi:alpha/beta fold hydrolase [Nocardia higoensis]|uniref:alpha/beta fold hydrolase n=1 Tax=Nocardia higoensis TaxID=228599 RepID=UPI0002E33BE4|nr:alpha/beta hydrolase [Nocardia higoensis]